jgi:hypothetical protein
MFEKIVAPSEHVLRPYLEAGLNRFMGAVVPHGIDPAVFNPRSQPFRYDTKKSFKVYEHRDEARAMSLKAAAVTHRDWTWKNAAQTLVSTLCPGCAAA